MAESAKRLNRMEIGTSDEEHRIISEKAQACRLTFSEFVRESALGYRVLRSPAPDINYQMWTRLADVGIEVRTMYQMIRAVWVDHLNDEDIDRLVQDAARGKLDGHFDLYGVLARLTRLEADLEALKAAVMGRGAGSRTVHDALAEQSADVADEKDGRSDPDSERIPRERSEADRPVLGGWLDPE